MAVIMVEELAGAGPEAAELIRRLGLLEKLRTAPGFLGHWSGTTSTGYRVVEVWDSAEAHQAWYDGSVKPNLPPGMEPAPPTYVDVILEARPS